MIRSPDDGVQLETHQAQSGSSSVGVPPATGGSTSCETPPENVPIPGPPLIDITTEAGLATDQPNQEGGGIVVDNTIIVWVGCRCGDHPPLLVHDAS